MSRPRLLYASYEEESTQEGFDDKYEYSEDWEADLVNREPNCTLFGFAGEKAVIRLDGDLALRLAYVHDLYSVTP